MMAILIRMPEVLTGATEAALQSWLVSPGDEITVGQPLAEVETEKATVEYEAEQAGTVAGLLIEVGVQVSVGTPIAVLAGPGESAEEALAAVKTDDPATATDAGSPEAESDAEMAVPETIAVDGVKTDSIEPENIDVEAQAQSETDVADVQPQGDGERLFASPLVRRMAR